MWALGEQLKTILYYVFILIYLYHIKCVGGGDPEICEMWPDREPSHWLDGGVLITATKCFTFCQYLFKYLKFSIYKSNKRNYIKFLLGYKLLNSPVCLHVQAIYVHGAKPNG